MDARGRSTQALIALVALACLVWVVPANAGDSPISRVPAQLLPDGAHGRIIYIDFWASWCQPCRRSFAFLNDMKKIHGADLVVVAVNVDRDREAAQRFLDSVDVDFHVVYDREGKWARLFDLQAMPSSFVYGRHGLLRQTFTGFRAKDIPEIEHMIKKLAAEAYNAE